VKNANFSAYTLMMKPKQATVTSTYRTDTFCLVQ